MEKYLYCQLPITDPRRAWISSDHTDISETFRRFEPILVCSIVGDDYDLVTSQDWLENGEFK